MAGTGKMRLEELERDRSVPGRNLAAQRKPVTDAAAKPWAPSVAKLLAGDYTVEVTKGQKPPKASKLALDGAAVGTPVASAPRLLDPLVRLTRPSTQEAKSTRTAGSKTPAPVGGAARVQVKDQATARKAGVDGVLFTAAPAATDSAEAVSGAVEVELDYEAIKDTYGGDWGSRLRLVQLPACALTTPDLPECRTRTELGGSNDPAAHTVSATVDLGAPAARGASAPMVLAAAAAASGPGGSHEATSLSPTGSWMAGSSSGGFSWSYPVESPEVPGGPQPEVELSYSSQAVDGRTASTNGQSSWLAEGWDYEPGFIERRFKSCSDDKAAEDGKTPNNSGETADLCWGSDHVVMSLGGNSSELVKDDATGKWRPADDDGTRLERKIGADNGTNGGEYWVLTGTDGVQYHFGLNKLPGAGTQRTDSALTVPVFGNHPGEPCHATAFADSDCAQAYRWNLDYVVDPLGDAMTLWWDKYTNYYGQHMKADKQILYTRSATLARIDYGQRASALFTGLPAGRVTFSTAERCIPSSTFDCAESKRTVANAKYWPDTPLDQECVAGAKCTDKYAPTFWSTKRLTKISTQVLAGSALKNVDSWTLEQSYPDTGDGTSPALWLASITRTGLGAGGTASMPKVSFAGTQMDNRVDGVEGLPPYSRMRVHAIDTESGGRIGVTYSPRECQALEPRKMPASPETNTMRCYPQYWTPKGATKPVQDWFHKYLATEVREDDLVTDAPDKVTSYEFIGSPAWAYDDGEFTERKERTWSQYRGYERVRTRVGGGSDVKQLTEHRFFRGMHGDKLPTGTRTASVVDSQGGSSPDLQQYQGQLREQISYEYDGGPVDSTTLTSTKSVKTAERKRTGTTPLQAWMARPETVTTRERVKGETWRTSTETTTYDSVGLPSEVDETTAGGKRLCTVTSYARNTALHLLESESRELTTVGACGTSGGEVVEDTRTLYDGQGFGVAPTKGLATEVQELNAKGDGYLTIDKTEYDIHGRETVTYDGEGRKTTVTNTPTTGVRPTKTVTTDPLGHTETTEFDDVRGMPVKETDANNKSATMQYDPLGRLLKVWEIDRDPATQTPTATYDYTIRRDGPTVVTNRSLKDNGEYAVSYELLDGLLRERQTQDEAVAGPGRIINDTFYDSAGRPWKTNDGYYHEAEPTPAVLQVGDNEVPSQSRTTFNGLGQPTADITYHRGVEKFRTTTERDGDVSTAVPPQGDTVTATFEDAEGRTAKIREYSNKERTTWRETSYEYDVHDNVVKITAPGGAVTTFEYDGRGRQTSSTDPDGGKTTLTYDNADNVVSSTDPRGNTLATTFDAAGRPTTVREGSVTGPKRMEWTYDTLGKGLPTAAIRYANGREYRDEVTAYDNAYRIKTTKTVVAAEEAGLGGTYTYSYGYTPTGNMATADVPGVGGLVNERVTFRYNSDDLPVSVRGEASYLNDVEYSAFGEILRTDAGTATKKVYGTYLYDEFTRRLTQSTFDRSINPGRISDTQYTYDEAGNVTKIKDTPGEAAPDSGKTDTQCFVHNQLRQMTSAWTATDDCKAAPSKANVGGTDAYWHQYEFDAAGNRTKLVDKDTAGDVAKDVTRTYTYGKPGVGGPNALAEIKSAGPGGERLNTFAYDKAGNTTTRQQNGTTQTLEWDIEGELASVTEPVEGGGSKKTSYLYGAGGERLIRTDSDGSKTLYLGEAELTVNADQSKKTAERFYPHPDGAATVRATGGVRQLVLADHHGSSHTTVDMVGTGMAVTRRKLMPFGEQRGPQPSTWPGARGFVGGSVDEDTGLTRLGARDYDPTTGRFMSVDPLVDYSQPATINPYAYSNNAPATFSDPTGTFFPILIGFAARMIIQAAIRAAIRRAAAIAARKAAQALARRLAAEARKRAIEAAKKLAAKLKREAAKKAAAAKRAAAKRAAAQRAAAKRAAQRRAAAQARARAQRAAAKRAATKRAAARKAAARPKPRPKPRSQPKPKPKPSRVKKPATAAAVAAGAKKVAKELAKDGADSSCESNSFTGRTLVLMADGSKKPINQVKVGEKVLATDPRTGQTSVQAATGTIVGQGQKNLVKVTFSEPGSLGSTTATVTATDGHPFWVPALSRWVEAKDIQQGTSLQTPTGTSVQVKDVQRWTESSTVHNLTVNDSHTYYVSAGQTSVLVHNCDGRLVSDGTASSATVSPQSLLDDAKALHDTFGVGTRADKGTTVATGQLGGELVYSVANNGTNRKLRALAQKLGYRRVYETDLTPQVHSDAEQILFNAIDEEEYAADGIIASSRPACGPSRQNCAGRASGYPGVQLWERSR
ncbi:polymorphic toxin-type HINT domain-containing protein [Streptomyces sp. NBC_00237]|uniref:polymorphic toxin-type HINT domain-containing protein n=1 Tax=Streptomyces sp. NBC_00237 TaxID=2975687 RepID=UPI00225369B9|nr:polymorphic toxin-type HINT domain-containing protein [Streptomyces sp. NBC_00237]MCX5203133.1 polymorphic toxin-type HINT domain-containing protein [Streptomyces sp. NBC_00237]